MFPRILKASAQLGAVVCASLCISSSALSDDVLLGANKQAQASEINLTQKTFNLVGNLGVGTTAAAQDPETGYLYYFEMNVDSGNGDTLNYWDPATGSVTVVRQYVPSPNIYIKRMAFHPDNTIYMSDDRNRMYTVDKTTGDITTLGQILGFESNNPNRTGGDMVFTPEGELYAINLSNLYYIDISTLTATLLYSNLVPVPGGISHFTGIGYCNGLFYATGLLFNNPNPTNLNALNEISVFSIDPSTGATQKYMQLWPPGPLVMINDIGSCVPDYLPDVTPPTVTITMPTSSPGYTTSSATIGIGGLASDNVAVDSIAWANDRGGSGTASGTDNWTVASIALQSGDNRITVTAADAAGNTSTDVLTVTYTPPDVTDPTVTITAPTMSPTYTTSSATIGIGGTASDDTGVTSVSWVNDRGGSGTATGTGTWTVASIALQSGDNRITVTAADAAGNTSIDVLTVTYSGVPVDVTPPTVTVTSPTTSPSYTTSSATIGIGGTASDDTGVTSVSWVNDRGGSGAASGTDIWTVASIALLGGDNRITVTAADAAGNTSTDVLTVTYTPPDVTDPTVTITTPTTAPSYTTSSATIGIGGTASDDTGVTSVSWVNDRGGSGTATGTGTWTVASVALQSGDNQITVTASDAAGNTSTDQIHITYEPGTYDRIIYGVDKDTGELREINLTRGTVRIVGDLIGSAAADQDPETGYLYYFETIYYGENGDALHYWDPNTGVDTIVRQYDPSPGIFFKRMAFAPDGTLYMSDENDIMYTIDKVTGDITTLGLVEGTVVNDPVYGHIPGGDIAFAPDGTLYHINVANLWTIDIPSLTGTLIYQDLIPPFAHFTGLAYCDGMLYGFGGNSSGTGIFSIDPATGETNLVIQTSPADPDWIQNIADHMIINDLGSCVAPVQPDVTAPTVTIDSPTAAPGYTTSSAAIAVGGTASDDKSVTSVTWANDRGGSGTASGTDNWTVASIALQSGDNRITVTAADAAGNTSTDVLTVTYTPPDVTDPTVTITAPTMSPTYTTSSATIGIGGTASDDTGVTSVSWVNDRGGSGTATGTGTWTVASIALQSGDNRITVTAADAAGNTSIDVLTVTYSGVPVDVTPPTVTVTSPTTSPSYTTSSATIGIGGTASDDTGVTSVSWVNDRGGSGAASGTDIWTVASIALLGGDNRITVTASDAAGNTSTDVLTVTYTPPDVTDPTVTITTPTTAPSYTTSSATIGIGGTASDDTGVTSVSWVNDRGGSGTATGTGTWTVASVALQSGDNQITVTASDAAGNTSTDILTVSYNAGEDVVVYSCDRDGVVLEINLTQDTATQVGQLLFGSKACEQDPDTGRLYYFEKDDGDRFAYWDPQTGQNTLVRTYTNLALRAKRMAFSPDRALYLGDQQEGLWIIDKDNGDLTFLGTLSGMDTENGIATGDMAFAADGTCYVVNWRHLYTIDIPNLAGQVRYPYLGESLGITGFTSLAWSNGKLYAISGKDDLGRADVEEIDPQTGDIATIINLSSGGDLTKFGNDMSSRPPYPPPNPPVAPPNLNAVASGDSQVDLSWDDISNIEQGFSIESRLAGQAFAQIAQVGPRVTSYSDAGLSSGQTYEYRVRAFNSAGDSGYSNTASATTPTPNVPPIALAQATPVSGTVPLAVNFTGSNSSDSDGTIVSYAWTFGDGGNSAQANPSHSYATAGTFVASLTVTDDDGATDTDTVTISVTQPANVSPVANAQATPSSGVAPLAVNFTGSNSSDSDGTIVSYAWTFGDGGNSAQANPSHSYATAGTFVASLTVTDDDGATDTDTVTISVTQPANVSPVANAQATPSSGVAPLAVNFTGSNSSDSDGTIVSYAWTFGDGGNSAQANPSHSYAAAGTFVASLTVTDDDGATDTDTVTISVTAPVNQAPVATITQPANGAVFAVGQTVQFAGNGTDAEDGTLPASAFTWEAGFFGGPFQPLASGVKSGSAVVPIPASIVIRLTVRDSKGLTNSKQVQITVTGN